MKKSSLLVAFILAASVLAAAAHAADTLTGSPSLSLQTSKDRYYAGESGFVVIRLDTYGLIEEVDMEVEVLSPAGKLVEGDMLYVRIPATTTVLEEGQSVQTIYTETLTYFGPGKSVYRTVPFEIPLDIANGEYTVAARAVYSGGTLKDETTVQMMGPGGFLDIIFAVYLVILALSVYMLRRS